MFKYQISSLCNNCCEEKQMRQSDKSQSEGEEDKVIVMRSFCFYLWKRWNAISNVLLSFDL